MARNFLKDEAKGVLRYCNCLNVKILEPSVKMVNDEVEKNLHTNNEFFMGYDSKLRYRDQKPETPGEKRGAVPARVVNPSEVASASIMVAVVRWKGRFSIFCWSS
uniref:Uncharacterized protein n=1 Tax=Populus trichocarpa TaxID=3694 RepID=B9IDS6_POPTR